MHTVERFLGMAIINHPKGPNLEKIQDRLKISISLENFYLA